jgi:hypothetical protein
MMLDNEFFHATVSQLVDYYGAADLALMLDVRPIDLSQWGEGKGRPPTEVLLRLIDLRSDLLSQRASERL